MITLELGGHHRVDPQSRVLGRAAEKGGRRPSRPQATQATQASVSATGPFTGIRQTLCGLSPMQGIHFIYLTGCMGGLPAGWTRSSTLGILA